MHRTTVGMRRFAEDSSVVVLMLQFPNLFALVNPVIVRFSS